MKLYQILKPAERLALRATVRPGSFVLGSKDPMTAWFEGGWALARRCEDIIIGAKTPKAKIVKTVKAVTNPTPRAARVAREGKAQRQWTGRSRQELLGMVAQKLSTITVVTVKEVRAIMAQIVSEIGKLRLGMLPVGAENALSGIREGLANLGHARIYFDKVFLARNEEVPWQVRRSLFRDISELELKLGWA